MNCLSSILWSDLASSRDVETSCSHCLDNSKFERPVLFIGWNILLPMEGTKGKHLSHDSRAFVNIVNIINICRSRQLPFLALAKKFHANPLGQWSQAAITWTRLRDCIHVWKSLLPICNIYHWKPSIPFKISNYLAHWPKWKTQPCQNCSLQHTGTLPSLVAISHCWISAYFHPLVLGDCRRKQKKI